MGEKMVISLPIVSMLFAIMIYYVDWTHLLKNFDKLQNIACGYCAKMACSEILLAGRARNSSIFSQELGQIPSFLFDIKIESSQVICALIGTEKRAVAVLTLVGCSLINENDDDSGNHQNASLFMTSDDSQWDALNLVPSCNPVNIDRNTRIQTAISHDIHHNSVQTETRALLVIHCNKIVAQGYAPGYNISSRFLGWSMTKTITNLLVGIRTGEGKMHYNDIVQGEVQVKHLMHMTDGLAFDEQYGMIGDPTVMLFLERNAAEYAARKTQIYAPGTRFCYSSGATNILQRYLKSTFTNLSMYLDFPRKSLFARINATSFVMEVDASNTFIGSSFSYATTQDWAKIGQLYLNRGVWNGEQVIPEEYFKSIKSQKDCSGGIYGSGWWFPADLSSNISAELDSTCILRSSIDKEYLRKALPFGSAVASGYRDQLIIAVPQWDLVVVRLGFNWDKTLAEEFIALLRKEYAPRNNEKN